MKLALLFLIPCVAMGRVGEKLDDFKKRTSAQAEAEWTMDGGIFYAEFFVDGIFVSVMGRDTIIFRELYDGVSEAKSIAISEKQPKSFPVKLKPGQDWRDATAKVYSRSYAERLEVSTREGDKIKELIDAEKERRANQKKKVNVDKF